MPRSRSETGSTRIDRRRFCLSLATAVGSCTTWNAARAAELATLAPDIKAIKDRGELIVGMTRFDSPPFYYQPRARARDGAPAALEGWDVEFARGLAQLLDVKLTVDREAPAFNDVVERVAAGAVDVGVSKLSITARRALSVRFTAPCIDLRHSLLVSRTGIAKRSGDSDIHTLLNRDFDGSLGVIANSSYAETAKHIFARASLHEFGTWDDVVDAANQGAIDLAYRDELEVKKLMRLRPELHLNLGSALITDVRDSIAFAVPSQSAQLLSVLNIMLAQRRHFDANQLLDQYADIFDAA